ncbi:MAG: hypothetical protein DHS20C05_02920 [Hyphococcus sp.]|nr:MAG: hypothetical protein DHS20C05_02920 [Marinicaulis sp.]
MKKKSLIIATAITVILVGVGIFSFDRLRSGRGTLADGSMMVKDFDINYSPVGGSRIYYSYHGTDLPDIYLKPDGGEEINLTDSNRTWDIEPDYSPDGRSIVYSSGKSMPSLGLRMMDADGANNHAFYDRPGSEVGASWSPDGKKIAFTSYNQRTMLSDIYVIDYDGSNLKNLTSDLPGASTGASWSHDGDIIVFDHAENPKGEKQIYAMRADGQNKVQLTFSPLSKFGPHFTPNEGGIIFTAEVDGYAQLFLMPASGLDSKSNGIRLTEENNQHAYFPSFSPDGQVLYYSTGDWDTGFSIASMKVPEAKTE